MAFERFRSPNRDLQNDEKRLDAIRRAVRDAIADAERELAGLRERIETARARAASLYGPEVDSDTRFDDHQGSRLREAEALLVRGEERLAELVRHMERLRDLEARV